MNTQNLPLSEIMELYNKKFTYKQISKYLLENYQIQISVSTIQQKIKEYCMINHIPMQQRIRRPKMSSEEILQANQKDKISYRQLAKINGVSTSTIQKIVQCNREKNEQTNFNPRKTLPVWKMIMDYENGATITQIAKKYEITEKTASYRINEYYEIIEGRTEKPKVITKKTFHSLINKSKKTGRTIEDIESFAKDNNIIIPQSYLNELQFEHDK